MRDYGKVSPQFWIGNTGRELKSKGPEALIVSMYLLTNPHANMIGMYYLPIIYIAHETGLGVEGASKGLQRAVDAGFCLYDEVAEVVWVKEMAKYQIAVSLKANDNRCIGIQREYDSQPKNRFLSMFFDKYQGSFNLKEKRDTSPENVRGFEGASKDLGSQEQEQEKEQERDTPPNPPREKKQYLYPQELNVHAWEEWKQYRRDLKIKAYAPTPRSEGAAITNLLKLSGGDLQAQAEIIKQSMANSWHGLFELKTGGNHETGGRYGAGDNFKGNAVEAVHAATARMREQHGLTIPGQNNQDLGSHGGAVFGQVDQAEWADPAITLDQRDWKTV